MLPLPEEEERHDNMTVEQNASVMLTEYIWLQADQSLKKKIIGTIYNKLSHLRSRYLMGENHVLQQDRNRRRDALSDAG